MSWSNKPLVRGRFTDDILTKINVFLNIDIRTCNMTAIWRSSFNHGRTPRNFLKDTIIDNQPNCPFALGSYTLAWLAKLANGRKTARSTQISRGRHTRASSGTAGNLTIPQITAGPPLRPPGGFTAPTLKTTHLYCAGGYTLHLRINKLSRDNNGALIVLLTAHPLHTSASTTKNKLIIKRKTDTVEKGRTRPCRFLVCIQVCVQHCAYGQSSSIKKCTGVCTSLSPDCWRH